MADHVDVQKLSPEKLMTGFSKSRIALGLIVAIGLHVAILAVTSMGYIRDTWIDPEGAERDRIAKVEAAEAAKAAERRQRDAERGAGATSRPSGKSSRDGDDPSDRVKSSPIYRATTQRAGPDETPPDPGDLKVPLE